MEDRTLRIGRFFTDTRILRCFASNCRFHLKDCCNLKQVSVDPEARCTGYEPRKAALPGESKLEMENSD
ncbi:MAG TPA: hypothetical protein PLM79_02950 [Syntrophobacteraceae bacterium]|nr:hypothetical protein [Syntrophobacteraceae bacterium]